MATAGVFQVNVKFKVENTELTRIEAKLRSLATKFKTIRVNIMVSKTSITPIINELNKLKTTKIKVPVSCVRDKAGVPPCPSPPPPRGGSGGGGGSGGRVGGNTGGGVVDNGIIAMADNALGAIAGVPMKAIKSAASLEEKLIDIRVALKAVGEYSPSEMDKLDALIKKVGAETKYTNVEIATTVETLITAGVSLKDVMGGMLNSTVNLSTAMRSDLSESASLLTDVMAYYRKMGVNAAEATNKVTAAALTSKFGFNDMAYAMAQGGTMAASYGVSLNELAIVLAGISPSFKNGRTAGTSFTWFLRSLDGKSNKAKEAMDSVGLNLVDEKTGGYKKMRDMIIELDRVFGKMSISERNAALTHMFHGEALNTVIGLLNMGIKGYDEIEKKQSGVVTQTMALEKQNSGLAMSYEKLTGAIDTLYNTIVNNTVLGWLSSFTDGLTNFVNKMTETIVKLQGLASLLSTINTDQSIAGMAADSLKKLDLYKKLQALKEGKSLPSATGYFQEGTYDFTKKIVNGTRWLLGQKPLVDRPSINSSPVKEMSPLERPNLINDIMGVPRSSATSNNNVTINQIFKGNANDTKAVKDAAGKGVTQALKGAGGA